ncbi:bile acid:sodium symporter family protein [Marinicauda algicola]|uniref:Bile acid:sodium symporter family protein n=1 Tax=Marinicauda algicola TaxID=2029849 RepID=A0A4S2H507_9PROT|nr:bile acid:sodium symporter family protein [Marinicauda algicola]
MDMTELDTWQISLDPRFELIMPVGLVVMMFAVALALKIEDFAFLRRYPARFAGAASSQIVGLPLLTLILVWIIQPIPSIAFGMIVVACCPGGNVSNFITHLARGNTALSVSLTATSSLAAALVTPISILFWSSLYPPAAGIVEAVEVEAGPFILSMGALLALPIAAGMAVRHYHPAIAVRIRPVFMIAALTIIVALVASGVARNPQMFMATGLVVLAIAALHNALAFGLGWVTGRALGFDAKGRRTMTFEVGIQNAGLGLMIVIAVFGGTGGAVAMTGTWSIWHLISGLLLAAGFRALDGWQARGQVKAAE